MRAPNDLPAPIGRREPATVRVELETIELLGQLDDGTSYRYWTFNGKVPGPMLRVRVGDTVEVRLKNPEDSWMTHNVDFHAVTGPGGGAGGHFQQHSTSLALSIKLLPTSAGHETPQTEVPRPRSRAMC